MQIVIIGNENNFKECSEKFSLDFVLTVAKTHEAAESLWQKANVVLDFILPLHPTKISWYQHKKISVLVNSALTGLLPLLAQGTPNSETTFFGFNGLPTFIKSANWEICTWRKEDEPALTKLMQALKSDFTIVADRPGFVAPKIIAMIINEAYLTVQEGTATREDIDVAMKLGTNYPYGPFEWCEKLGKQNVLALLNAAYADTKDERYKPSALLKKESLLATIL
ncbi:MAG: 3-hydroxyacyl-CoA dehydrogenase family protein [Cyclobacteriaceae bacterium]|jgi:3-hydroxybutyryl-CoA dehydrogenase|nr:3-hydroxyacyl-CoA dehydrogenase family protein [Cyclobacteriaceae bacterium]